MIDIPALSAEAVSRGTKRKKAGDIENDIDTLEIDINAPEPPSKKALRRAKRAKATSLTKEDRTVSTDRRDSPNTTGASKTEAVSSRSPHGIWIGNLPFFVTKKDLQAFLTDDPGNEIPPDQITRIHLPSGPPKPGSRFQNKGFAYIDFASAKVVEKALLLSEKLVGGRRVLIKSSKDYQGRPDSTSKPSNSRVSTSKRIFVGNLEFELTKQDLERHFEICGPVHDVHMATFEDSGKCKGYAWVEFEQLPSAEAAMRGWVEISDAAHNSEKENRPVGSTDSKTTKKRVWVSKMGGRKLRMEYAEDKATRYKKRFGRESWAEGAEDVGPDNTEEVSPNDKSRRAEELHDKLGEARSTSSDLRKGNNSKFTRPGYEVFSVQKMTGAIVDGKGTKITFE
jgi:RNA recognition motif-containing protein